GGFHVDDVNTRVGLPVCVASMPSKMSLSTPAWFELPSVTFVPSVTQPRLLNNRSPSLPISVRLWRVETGACRPFGLVGPGVNGAGLWSTSMYAFALR